jgi:hypothetical protein
MPPVLLHAASAITKHKEAKDENLKFGLLLADLKPATRRGGFLRAKSQPCSLNVAPDPSVRTLQKGCFNAAFMIA